MKKPLLIALLMFSNFVSSQNAVAEYPEGQNPYKNGNTELFKDINTWLVTNNEKPCDKNEMYWVTLRINENGQLFLVRNKKDQLNAEKNKCAFDMLVRVLGNLKNWQPAEIKGKKVTSYFDFPFIPKDYFHNFQENYDITKTTNRASYPGGVDRFRAELKKYVGSYIDYDLYKPKGRFVLLFSIDENGNMENIDIEPKVENSERFFEDIKFGVKRMKGKWEPAKINGTPVQSKFRFPLVFSEDD